MEHQLLAHLSDPAPREVELIGGAATGASFTLATLTLPPHSAGAEPDVHAGYAEGHYVLSGTLAATVGERTVIVRAGEAFYVAAGVPHTCWNPAAAPAVVLLIATPAPAASAGRPVASDERTMLQ